MVRILNERKIKLNRRIFKQVKNRMRNISKENEKLYEKELMKIVEEKLEKCEQPSVGIGEISPPPVK